MLKELTKKYNKMRNLKNFKKTILHNYLPQNKIYKKKLPQDS